jgi:hypothetical protein
VGRYDDLDRTLGRGLWALFAFAWRFYLLGAAVGVLALAVGITIGRTQTIAGASVMIVLFGLAAYASLRVDRARRARRRAPDE